MLHRSGVPLKDETDNSINCLEQRAKGPGAPLADCKHRKTYLGILQGLQQVCAPNPHAKHCLGSTNNLSILAIMMKYSSNLLEPHDG
uniref:Uncharacterized protein n=1 Tax=Romanomermis culicivorax TaxID=13658 RepID=A0A915L838_ROMCU